MSVTQIAKPVSKETFAKALNVEDKPSKVIT